MRSPVRGALKIYAPTKSLICGWTIHQGGTLGQTFTVSNSGQAPEKEGSLGAYHKLHYLATPRQDAVEGTSICRSLMMAVTFSRTICLMSKKSSPSAQVTK